MEVNPTRAPVPIPIPHRDRRSQVIWLIIRAARANRGQRKDPFDLSYWALRLMSQADTLSSNQDRRLFHKDCLLSLRHDDILSTMENTSEHVAVVLPTNTDPVTNRPSTVPTRITFANVVWICMRIRSLKPCKKSQSLWTQALNNIQPTDSLKKTLDFAATPEKLIEELQVKLEEGKKSKASYTKADGSRVLISDLFAEIFRHFQRYMAAIDIASSYDPGKHDLFEQRDISLTCLLVTSLFLGPSFALCLLLSTLQFYTGETWSAVSAMLRGLQRGTSHGKRFIYEDCRAARSILKDVSLDFTRPASHIFCRLTANLAVHGCNGLFGFSCLCQ